MGVRCLLVDDDAFTRTTLASALQAHGVVVVSVADGIAQAITALATSLSSQSDAAIQCAVLDLDLGLGPNGIDLAHALRRRDPDIGIVILTSFTDPRLLATSLRELPEGSAYVVKQSLEDMDILLSAIEGVTCGQVGTAPAPRVALSDAQIETLRLLACGLSNAEIARVRVVTEKSVEQAIKRVAVALSIDTSSRVNQRVALARAYFSLTGADRHTHARR